MWATYDKVISLSLTCAMYIRSYSQHDVEKSYTITSHFNKLSSTLQISIITYSRFKLGASRLLVHRSLEVLTGFTCAFSAGVTKRKKATYVPAHGSTKTHLNSHSSHLKTFGGADQGI